MRGITGVELWSSFRTTCGRCGQCTCPVTEPVSSRVASGRVFCSFSQLPRAGLGGFSPVRSVLVAGSGHLSVGAVQSLRAVLVVLRPPGVGASGRRGGLRTLSRVCSEDVFSPRQFVSDSQKFQEYSCTGALARPLSPFSGATSHLEWANVCSAGLLLLPVGVRVAIFFQKVRRGPTSPSPISCPSGSQNAPKCSRWRS